jgi:hypothetical protein
VGKHRVRKMTFKKLRGPSFPFLEELLQRFHPVILS